MEDWDNIDRDLKEEIKAIARTDPYSLNPVTLFRNIKYSTGSNEELALIFDVEISLVEKIKKES